MFELCDSKKGSNKLSAIFKLMLSSDKMSISQTMLDSLIKRLNSEMIYYKPEKKTSINNKFNTKN